MLWSNMNKSDCVPKRPHTGVQLRLGSHEITSTWLPPKGEALRKPHPAVCHHWKRHTKEHRDTLRSTGPTQMVTSTDTKAYT